MKKMLILSLIIGFKALNCGWIHYSDLADPSTYKNLNLAQLESEKILLEQKLKSMDQTTPHVFAQDRHYSRIDELKKDLSELNRLIQEKQ